MVFMTSSTTHNHDGKNCSSMKLFIATVVIAFGIYCCNGETVIEPKGTPDSVVWVVQLSDLHLSVHHPNRAHDFTNLVGHALSIINPSLVLITGDLTGTIIHHISFFNFQVSSNI